MKNKLNHNLNDIITIENLLFAWKAFENGKKNKKDVQEFGYNLFANIYELYNELISNTYSHSSYIAFKINDPKPRDIHKALVRDRVVHHLLYTALYPYFDNKFIYDSYSCRAGNGTHKALNRFRDFGRRVSKNNTKTCWVLKCDIKKLFASIDHTILITILEKQIQDKKLLDLLINIINSFSARQDLAEVGLPLGNLTSQLLVNIYMNEFDQFVKHRLKEKYYIRYADDFVFMSQDKQHLEKLITVISEFLENDLKLQLHPNKVYIKTLSSGVDFLGWVHFSHHRVLRTATKRRMLRTLKVNNYKKESLISYKGMLKYGDGYNLTQRIDNNSYRQRLRTTAIGQTYG